MEDFAINSKLLIAQIVNFGLLLFLLAKFAYKPVVAMLEERKKTIAEGLDKAEKADKLLSNVEIESKKKNEEAYLKAKDIVDGAQKEASEKALKIITSANDQADQIVSRAQAEAELAKSRALKEAKNEIGSLVSLALDKIIGEGLDNKYKEQLTAKAIEEL